MAHRVYHWKHGWIPLDLHAALSKAHGSEPGARRYLSGSHASGVTHESVIHGGYGGGTHVRGLHPVASEYLPRDSHIIAAHDPNTRKFALLDKRGARIGFSHEFDGKEVTASIPEDLAEQFHARGYRIQGIKATADGKKILTQDHEGNLKLFAADGSDRYRVDPGIDGGDFTGDVGGSAPGTDHREHYPETHTITPSQTNDRYSVIRPNSGFGGIDVVSRRVGDHISSHDERVIGYQRRVITTVDKAGVVRRYKADGSNVDKPVIAKNKSGDFKRRDIAGFTHVPAHESIPDDGSAGGTLSAAKIKRAYVKGNTRVLIEPQLSDAQTEEFLGHINTALEATKGSVTHPVTIHVPTGHRAFSRGVRGFVYVNDQHRVHIRPSVARGELDPNEGTIGGQFSDAASGVNPAVYILVHELGHTVDNREHHTRPGGNVARQEEELSFFRQHRTKLSRYGTTNVAEGYAETFAHFHLRRRHTSSLNDHAADEYSARYGWRS